MGCGSSKSVKAKARPPRPRSNNRPASDGGGGGSDNSSEESDADRIYAFKDTLRKRALQLFLAVFEKFCSNNAGENKVIDIEEG